VRDVHVDVVRGNTKYFSSTGTHDTRFSAMTVESLVIVLRQVQAFQAAVLTAQHPSAEGDSGNGALNKAA
jgi:hypothetical protein